MITLSDLKIALSSKLNSQYLPYRLFVEDFSANVLADETRANMLIAKDSISHCAIESPLNISKEDSISHLLIPAVVNLLKQAPANTKEIYFSFEDVPQANLFIIYARYVPAAV